MFNQSEKPPKRRKQQKQKDDRLEQGHIDSQPKPLGRPFNGLPLSKLPDADLIK